MVEGSRATEAMEEYVLALPVAIKGVENHLGGGIEGIGQVQKTGTQSEYSLCPWPLPLTINMYDRPRMI